MNEVSTTRLYVLRAAYLFIAVGLALMIGPLLIDPPANLEHPRGVMWALLGGVGTLALLGLRYPLQMLPLLMFELVWKTIWLGAIALPAWRAGQLTPAITSSITDTTVGIALVLIVLPWRYVFENYVRRPGDRWTRRAAHASASARRDAGQTVGSYAAGSPRA